MTRTLALILAALALVLGSFIWFVASWEPDARPTLQSAVQPTNPELA